MTEQDHDMESTLDASKESTKRVKVEATPSTPNKKDAHKLLILQYMNQLQKGCGRKNCDNEYCASNPKVKAVDKSEALKTAILLASKGKKHLCVHEEPAKPTAAALDVEAFLRQIQHAKSTGSWGGVNAEIDRTFAHEEALSLAFVPKGSEGTTPTNENPAILFSELDSVMEAINAHEPSSKALSTAFNNTAQAMMSVPRTSTPLSSLRALIIMAQSELFQDPDYFDTYKTIFGVVGRLADPAIKILIGWLAAHWAKERFETMLGLVQQYLTVRFFNHRPAELVPAAKFANIIYQANEQRVKADAEALAYTDFYNDGVNQMLDPRREHRHWRAKDNSSFAEYPFLLDPSLKAALLQYESSESMQRHFHDAMLSSMLLGRISPYLILRVRRDNILQDTLEQIQQKNTQDLKKPLKVQFVGEEGIDEGGVQKEFFQLLVSQLFDPKFGMFVVEEEAQSFWFNKDSLESTSEFELIGILLGLAIYNSVILDIKFPSVVYKKLMKQPLDLKDLTASFPAMGKGLQQLLEFTGDVEDTYMRTLSVTYDVFGESRVVELKPGGADIPLTNQNRQEYVDLYVSMMLEKSIHKQFQAFEEGFHMVCGGDALKLFRWEEVELLICGSPELDFYALQEATQYENFTPEMPIIRDFWGCVHAFNLEDKKKFLSFCTGSDRAPIKGLGAISFVISRNGPDSDRLPTAHTCFNHLLLPHYSSKEKIKKCLLLAIANSKGFGLM